MGIKRRMRSRLCQVLALCNLILMVKIKLREEKQLYCVCLHKFLGDAEYKIRCRHAILLKK